MLTRVLSLLSILFPGHVYAQEMRSTPVLNLTEIADTIQEASLPWTPNIFGLSRYNFNLPKYGVQEAVKYNDASALFYLSDVQDDGLSLEKSRSYFNLTANLENFSLEYTLPITPENSISLETVRDDGFESYLRFTTKTVSATSSLHSFSAVFAKDDFGASYSGVSLSNDELYETFWTASTREDKSLLIGWRWFDVIENLDVAINYSTLGPEHFLNTSLESDNNFFGLEFDSARNNARIILGLRYTYSTTHGLSRNDHLSAQGLPTLKATTRNNLPQIWSDAISFDTSP